MKYIKKQLKKFGAFVWSVMSKKRYLGDHPKCKKAVLVSFLVVVVSYVGFNLHGQFPSLDIRMSGGYTLENDALAHNLKPSETVAEEVDPLEAMLDLIWLRESTRGKNNFSKCESIGKVNGIGYGIPGDGTYMCFDSHEDEMTVLRGWIVAKKAQGMSDTKMLCLYSGNNYKECKK